MTQPARRVLGLAAAIATGVLLAACATPPTSGPGVIDPTPEAATGPECLIGQWRITQDQLQFFYDSVSADTADDIAYLVTGETGLDFDGTHYSYSPDLSLSIRADGLEGVGYLHGTIEGTYTTDASTIETTTESTNVSYVFSMGGVEQDASDAFAEALQSAPINGGAYECTAAGPIIQFDNGYARVPIQLTR
jgi:hypothetical protein